MKDLASTHPTVKFVGLSYLSTPKGRTVGNCYYHHIGIENDWALPAKVGQMFILGASLTVREWSGIMENVSRYLEQGGYIDFIEPDTEIIRKCSTP